MCSEVVPSAAPTLVVLCLLATATTAKILTPPYFNLAEGRKIYASATCGEDIDGPELYCKLVGPTNAESDLNSNVIQGHHCDICDPNRPDKRHPPEHAVDGLESWWQSPPLSRGMKYNEVNLTIDLGQEFHVAYVYIRMGNSPRPGLWVLEKSVDYGKSFKPWQYFSDSKSDCLEYFGAESLQPITRDDSIICSTEHSRIVPLEGGEIPISILNNRPSANHYFNSTILQEWTRATNVRLRLLRTKNLYGHLMSVARQDPTVTRRYFYSIKDISIGGRCMCNGHADTCDNRDPSEPEILVCLCRHNTCGQKCNTCCPGFEQKAWRISKHNAPFECERCNCFNHSDECVYDSDIDEKHLSLDIRGNYEGGGVCQNCKHNTEGINCNKCKAGYYKPYSKNLNDTDVCQPCDCDRFYSTGSCAEGSGLCECRKEFNPPNCDSCSFGYYAYPNCKPCDCYQNGTIDLQCQASNGSCTCKYNFAGENCSTCADEFYNFPTCEPCECNPLGSIAGTCDLISGNCTCKNNYGGKQCDQCQNGYYSYPSCPYCDCDAKGTEPHICDKESGKCICKEGYGGDRCDQCVPGYFGYPDCRPCNCSAIGSASTVCDISGKCPCLSNFAGRTCEGCSPGYYKYPDCLPCNCDSHGSIGISCNHDGICQCHHNFNGDRCDSCLDGFYNFPSCEECNCNPAGVIAAFAGCGSVPKGELCQCKERVEGRICDRCKPLYWNLNTFNPDGCEECDCFAPGVLGGLAICDNDNGQCTCKPSVVARGCTECQDGTYDLQNGNLFGCTDCGCDVGGSVNTNCDKVTGQCACQPRVNGRTCKEALQAHYFPSLYQMQYELEDGYTQESTLRSDYNETDFPEYSWKGYAAFSLLQKEVSKDISIYKPSIYRIVLRYVNKNTNTVTGTIKIIPENPTEIEQKYQVQFKNTTSPSFYTVTAGNVPVPFVMNPGKWTVSIQVEGNMLIDYFVLLPEEFYLATILTQKIETPCTIGEKGLCREFRYPNISSYDTSLGAGGYLNMGANSIATLTEYYENSEHLAELGIRNRIPLLNKDQNEIDYNITVSKPGRYVILVNYLTPLNENRSHTVGVSVPDGSIFDAKIEMYNCNYATLCRQVVTDVDGTVSVFDAEDNMLHVQLSSPDSNVGIHSITLIPYDEWSLDFIQPRSVCIRKGDTCIASSFRDPPESKKIVLKKEALVHEGPPKPIVNVTNTSSYIYLSRSDKMVDVRSKVNTPGFYSFVVHYYQPEFPEYDVDVLIQNGFMYEAKLPVKHCPSKGGCRALVTQKDGVSKFSLTENFMITLQLPEEKNVYLNYILVIPHDLYNQRILEEEDLDRTDEFISTCGNNHFHIDTNDEGFCKESVFSISTGYNNGAQPCMCDFDGSLSFQCKQFGGQCECRENVIGRQCSICKTGYYGFPDCKQCDCPSTSRCDPQNGQCICPPRVIGERCDQCEPHTYGFDPYSGCSDCKCDPLGVQNTLQCDINNGSCPCKDNIVGRRCNTCNAGYFAFPYCEACECELRGTKEDICDQQTAECFCKKFVTGAACELCVEGSYDLQERNELGCTECFCFGRTNRCGSSNLYRAIVGSMQNWGVVAINESDKLVVQDLFNKVHYSEGPDGVYVDLVGLAMENTTIYFSAPSLYLGRQLTSYGGFLNYTIFYSIGLSGKATLHPDVILEGVNSYLTFYGSEQPAADISFPSTLQLVEANFVLPNGLPAKREHIMTVLKELKGIYVRATYWSATSMSSVQNVLLDIGVETVNTTDFYDILATSVEVCECPPNYEGLSCEECAPGYYRVSQGPHGGYCAPCQCHGHAEECDVNTGVCLNCQHNTVGEHCDQCAVGYHGNAVQGSPNDCLICACPLPVTSNNFATGCEFSEDGEKISCDCVEGYIGARCSRCAAGYYGKPDVLGEYCKPCECSGNIDTSDLASCDTLTGQCLKCLNNSWGEACALCAPKHYGDAIGLKDCQPCVCDESGMDQCDSYTGECICRENVIGDKCDRCEVDHYGFQSGRGCQPCNCGEASTSSQCDDATGQCRCQPGVTGRTCDKCAAGYWNYTAEGCASCGCKSEYSLGFGCNALTGQCECLQGVTGDKCDHCPYRWTFVHDYGCFGCDSCTHDLLDITDELAAIIDPIQEEYDIAESGYFTTRKLMHINDTIEALRPKVLLLSPEQINFGPLIQEIESIEQESNNMNRKANYSLDNSKSLVKAAGEVRSKSMELLDDAGNAKDDADDAVKDVEDMSTNLTEGEEPKVATAVQEAEAILKYMSNFNLSDLEEDANNKLGDVLTLLDQLNTVKQPSGNTTDFISGLKDKLKTFNDNLDDLSNQTQFSLAKTAEGNEMYDRNRKDLERLQKKLNNIINQTNDLEKNLDDSGVLLQNASRHLSEVQRLFDSLQDDGDKLSETNLDFSSKLDNDQTTLAETKESKPVVEDHVKNLTEKAQELDHLFSEIRNISDDPVRAANAYKEMIEAISQADVAALESKKEVDETGKTLNGTHADAEEESNALSMTLLDVTDLKDKLENLVPRVEGVKLSAEPLIKMHTMNNDQLKNIDKFLENYQTKSLDSSLLESKLDAEDADGFIVKTEEDLGIFDQLSNMKESAKQLPKKVYDAQVNTSQIIKQLDKINKMLPENLRSLQNQPSKSEQDKQLVNEINDKIEKLNQMIALARDMANRVEVGLKFKPSTMVELRNPNNLADLSTSTQISGYFKTDKPNGLIYYLGNGKGTNLRKTKSDDYMALEIENGYAALTMDLGNGAERINSEKFVSDNNWYQFIIDRTGLNAKLTIKEELPDGNHRDTVNERQLQGPYSIFNLDRNQSKLFVGSYPLEFNMQDEVKQNAFEGDIESLVVGETPVSMWNFVNAFDNNLGALEKDKLRDTPTTGYRFNGNGYTIFNARTVPLGKRSLMQLSFKTFAPEGLVFLYGNNKKAKTFTSLELIGGRVVYKYNLGGETKIWITPRTYNDGNWHTVEATRDGPNGRFTVDNEEIADRTAPVSGSTIELDEFMFIGGYPQHHQFADVTNVDFDGCIDNVVIMRNPVNLKSNLKAYGVTPGCPVKFSRLVSFRPDRPGFVKRENVITANNFKINLKFKTKEENGLIFYAVDRNQDHGMSLSIQDGYLKLISQKIATRTNAVFNDNEWHIVNIRHTDEMLRIDFDDYGHIVTDSRPPVLHILYGDLFIGGLPENYRPRRLMVAMPYVPFAGCIGDATINGSIINFANLTTKYNEEVGKCILDKEIGSDSFVHSVPELPPIAQVDVYATPEPERRTERPFDSGGPHRGDGGRDTGDSESEGEDDHSDTDNEPDVEHHTDADLDIDSVTENEIETDHDHVPEHVPDLSVLARPTPRPPPVVSTRQPPICALPMDPEIDQNLDGSYRYGTSMDSRTMYYTPRGKFKKQYDFSLEFRTSSSDGVLFYATDANRIQFNVLYLHDGHLIYKYSSGMEPAVLATPERYNDDKWHAVQFSRELAFGKLVVADELKAEGRAAGSQKIDLATPFFLGGVDNKTWPYMVSEVNVTDKFAGCIRNFHMNNKLMEHPELHGVIPCSDNLEPGLFFSSQGGYAKLKERFKVGYELDAKMDIKPRNLSGVILAVQGRKDYFVLELDNGALKLTVENGKGAISTRYQPSEPHLFCDGHWHSIQAVKSKSVVTLAVNGVYSDPGVGDHRSTSTDTGGYLFLGGHRVLSKARGVTVRTPYVGCIKNVQINNQPVHITPHMVENGVTVGTCPTN